MNVLDSFAGWVHLQPINEIWIISAYTLLYRQARISDFWTIFEQAIWFIIKFGSRFIRSLIDRHAPLNNVILRKRYESVSIAAMHSIRSMEVTDTCQSYWSDSLSICFKVCHSLQRSRFLSEFADCSNCMKTCAAQRFRLSDQYCWMY